MEWADACSLWLSQCSYKHKTCTVFTHPGRFLSSTPPPSCPSYSNSSSIYSATTMALFWSVVLRAKSSYPVIGCLWQCGQWQGSTILNFSQGNNNLARFLRAGSAPWHFFSLRIQHSPVSCTWGGNRKGGKDKGEKEWQILNRISDSFLNSMHKWEMLLLESEIISYNATLYSSYKSLNCD